MITLVSRRIAAERHLPYVLPNGTDIALDTYLGTNLVALATERGSAPQHMDTAATYPMAYLVQQSANSEVLAHFHQADQFQLFVGGSGRIGTHTIEGLDVHFARSHSPYGPIVAGSAGLKYMTFRNSWDPGAQWMPGAAATLRKIPNRKHLARTALLDTRNLEAGMVAIVQDAASGLGVWLLRVDRDEAVVGPAPREGGGQFWYCLEGEVEHEGARLEGEGLIFAGPGDPHVHLVGRSPHSTLVLMQFPRRENT